MFAVIVNSGILVVCGILLVGAISIAISLDAARNRNQN